MYCSSHIISRRVHTRRWARQNAAYGDMTYPRVTLASQGISANELVGKAI